MYLDKNMNERKYDYFFTIYSEKYVAFSANHILKKPTK